MDNVLQLHGMVKACTAFLKLEATDGLLLPFLNAYRDLIRRTARPHVAVEDRPFIKLSLENHIFSIHVNVVTLKQASLCKACVFQTVATATRTSSVFLLLILWTTSLQHTLKVY